MAEQALILQLRPKLQELRDARMYTEAGVKRIMFEFARDIGCKWSDTRLRAFIEQCFDFDL